MISLLGEEFHARQPHSKRGKNQWLKKRDKFANMQFLTAFCILVAFGSAFIDATPVRSRMLEMLKEPVPLELEFCESLGYSLTSRVNFMKQTNQSAVAEDYLYKALKIMHSTGCSKFTKPYTCATYAPALTKRYGALPPCRSLCTRTEEQCGNFNAAMAKLLSKGKYLFVILLKFIDKAAKVGIIFVSYFCCLTFFSYYICYEDGGVLL